MLIFLLLKEKYNIHNNYECDTISILYTPVHKLKITKKK